MTVRQYLYKYLYSNALFEDQCNAILDEVVKDPDLSAVRFESEAEGEGGYPKAMLNALLFATKRHAKEWLETNMPLHWALPMFDDEKMKEIMAK